MDRLPKFEININNMKFAGTEKDVSRTIEELLELNDKIPSRWKEDPECITEAQFDKNKKHNGEILETTESQFGEREEPNYQIIEVEAETKTPENNGHRPDSQKTDEIEMNGHKNIPPIWIEVYNKENERKNK